MDLSRVVIDKGNGYEIKDIVEAIEKLPDVNELFSNSPMSKPFKLEEDKLIAKSIKRFGKDYIQIFLPKPQASYVHLPKGAGNPSMSIGKPPSLVFEFKGFNYELHLGPPGKNLYE